MWDVRSTKADFVGRAHIPGVIDQTYVWTGEEERDKGYSMANRAVVFSGDL